MLQFGKKGVSNRKREELGYVLNNRYKATAPFKLDAKPLQRQLACRYWSRRFPAIFIGTSVRNGKSYNKTRKIPSILPKIPLRQSKEDLNCTIEFMIVPK